VRYYVVSIFVRKMFKGEKANEEDYQRGFQVLSYLYETMAGIYVSRSFSKKLRIAWLSLSCIAVITFCFTAPAYYASRVIQSNLPINYIESIEVLYSSMGYAIFALVVYPILGLWFRKDTKTTIGSIKEIHNSRKLSLETETFVKKVLSKKSVRMKISNSTRIMKEAGFRDHDLSDMYHIHHIHVLKYTIFLVSVALGSIFSFFFSTFGYVLIFGRDKSLNVIDYPLTIPFYDYISSHISYSLICIGEIIVFDFKYPISGYIRPWFYLWRITE